MDNQEEKQPAIVRFAEVPIFTTLQQKYLPAESFKDATVLMSTREIRDKIMQHVGEMLSLQDVYEWMKDTGYREDCIGESLNLVWLMKETSEVFGN